MNETIQKAEELQEFCNYLEEIEAICNTCANELRKGIEIIVTKEINPSKIEILPNINLHINCTIRLLRSFRGFVEHSNF